MALAVSNSGSRHRTGTGFTLSVTKQEHRQTLFGLLAHNPLILRMRASYQIICRLIWYLVLGRKTSNSFRFYNGFLLSVNLASVLCRDPESPRRCTS